MIKISPQVTKWMVAVLVLVAVAGLVLEYRTNLTLAAEMREGLKKQQEFADLLRNSLAFKLINWASGGRMWEECPAPSTEWVFVPIVGRGMAERRYQAHMEYMVDLERQAMAAIATLLRGVSCLLAVVVSGSLVLVVWFLRRPCGGQGTSADQLDDAELYCTADAGDDAVLRVEEDEVQHLTPDTQDEDDTRMETDHKFLMARIPFMTSSDIDALMVYCDLGRGTYGKVTLVKKEEQLCALKQMLRTRPKDVRSMLREARLSVELDGAGGVPKALAVCPEPPAVLLEYTGHTYGLFLAMCSTAGLLDSLASIASRLNELHRAGLVHNDLKATNITFSGTIKDPVFHLVDLGLATRPGEVVNLAIREEERAKYWWYAPELLERRPVFTSADVYSFGTFVQTVLEVNVEETLKEDLQWLIDACLQHDPTLRPSLAKVMYTFRSVKASKPWLYGE